MAIEIVASPEGRGRLPWLVRRELEHGWVIVDTRTVSVPGLGQRVVYVLEKGGDPHDDG